MRTIEEIRADNVKEREERNANRKVIKAYCNFHGYSDVEPFEVVKKFTDRKVGIRRMKAEKDLDQKMEFIPGGFSAICTNIYDQKWNITSDPDGEMIVVRWSKAKGVWQSKGGSKYSMSDAPYKFYDYNF